MLDHANPRSIRANREYGGLIYRTDAGYWFTGPVLGRAGTVNPHLVPIPPGADLVGNYHTHGDYAREDPVTGRARATGDPAQDDYDSDRFSTVDRNVIRDESRNHPGFKGYLGTPSGAYKVYDPATDRVAIL